MALSAQALAEGVETMEDAGLKSREGSEFSDRKAGTWLALFSDWDDERFLAACVLAAQTMTFFPSVGELRSLEKEDPLEQRDLAVAAWETCRQAIRTHGWQATLTREDLGGDGAALWALDRVGAERIGMMEMDSVNLVASEFRGVYAVARSKGYSLDRLPGLFETRNLAAGIDAFASPALIGRPDLKEGSPSLGGDQPPALGDGGNP